jgi:crotonobetainyl-CoA:carnitine CoA-transferase CaiB-like acyl-CoA transferase
MVTIPLHVPLHVATHPSVVPYQAFRYKDKDIVVAIGNDQQGTSFCQATGLQRLQADRKFSTNQARVKNRHLRTPVLQRMFHRRTAKEWEKILDQARVPATTVFSTRDLIRDPHIRYRRMIVGSNHASLIGSPMRLNKTKSKGATMAPPLGENSREILAEFET